MRLPRPDLTGIDLSRLGLPRLDLRAIDGPIADAAKDAAYIAIGTVVLAVQSAQVRRRELITRLGGRNQHRDGSGGGHRAA